MILDGHIHIHDERPGTGDDREAFHKKLKKAGIDGGIVISSPSSWRGDSRDRVPYKERLERLFYWADGNPHLYPFFWIEPMEGDALKQVDDALKAGVKGFKVICQSYYPSDSGPMAVFRHIAAQDKPILFHSGILWDGTPSSPFNRPAAWEAMLRIKGIRFALAHISWPWCDECVAVFGKFQAAMERGHRDDCEMFIDTTPGTPPIFRQDALYKVFKTGYQVATRVFFGTDGTANSYGFNRAKELLSADRRIVSKIRVPKKDQVNYFSENLKRFVGL